MDDEAIVREITAEGLRVAGFAVRAAEGAAEALELLDDGEGVDFLVSDLSMPGLDGLTLMNRPATPGSGPTRRRGWSVASRQNSARQPSWRRQSRNE